MKQMLTSWGNYPIALPAEIICPNWRDDTIAFHAAQSFLPYGQGRSYGDSCLNADGILIDTKRLNHLLSFDRTQGILACEAGVTLAEILDFIMPEGWFLPVLPGTQFVSVGGAIANDIHGKNHHVMGTFGRHVLSFELLRSNGEILLCSPESNRELYQATIGGLGLTGLVLSAKLQLRPLISPLLQVEYLPFHHLDEFMQLAAESENTFEYTVAWLDCANAGKKFGRGIFMRANHAQEPMQPPAQPSHFALQIPAYFPSFSLNRFTIKKFNDLYYYLHTRKPGIQNIYYKNFFFPLDAIKHWNRIYGKRGFVQYHCVLPKENLVQMNEILTTVVAADAGAFLSVLKTFGDLPSPGMLSFPMPGITLALDFPLRGDRTLSLLNTLDTIVSQAQGRVYPAKDARMSASAFQTFFPRWQDFQPYIDPKFSSSFWRRVTST